MSVKDFNVQIGGNGRQLFCKKQLKSVNAKSICYKNLKKPSCVDFQF